MVMGLVPVPSVFLQGHFTVSMGDFQFWPELGMGLERVAPLFIMQWVLLEVMDG